MVAFPFLLTLLGLVPTFSHSNRVVVEAGKLTVPWLECVVFLRVSIPLCRRFASLFGIENHWRLY